MDIFIAGIVPFTTIDYPGCLSAVLFLQGCPWRCHYCHNPHLQPFTSKGSLSWDEILHFLSDRKGFLEAVVFSGGEPTSQKRLGAAMSQVKALGMKVGLHTASTYPGLLKEILRFIDWVGMDIKAPFDSYEKVTKIPESGKNARLSAELILASGADYEFRTTVHPTLLSIEDLMTIADQLKKMKAHSFVLQKFRPDGCNEQALNQTASFSWDDHLIHYLKKSFPRFEIRE